jgi:putative restriction endonuclease
MDNVGPLTANHVVGRFEPLLERQLAGDPALVATAARALAESHFPPTVAPDVLAAVGFDPETVLSAADVLPYPSGAVPRRRDAACRDAVIQAWDRQCAFCGYDGQVRGATVGVDAAHVRWFAFDGPDTMDNGLAACSLHHVLFDRGVLGIDQSHQIHVSNAYSARTDAGRALYDLHGRRMRARSGTPMPAAQHAFWHRSQVFKGDPLAA